MTYIVNLFGTGIRYWICDLDAPIMAPVIEYKQKHLLSWDKVLFDLSLLKKLGYSHWSELTYHRESSGMFLSTENRIELKKGSRFLLKFRADELHNDRTLFPRFQTRIEPAENILINPLVILQIETGLMGKYKIEAENIQIDDLTFVLTQPISSEPDLLFTGLSYKGKSLKRTNEDTVVRGLRVVLP